MRTRLLLALALTLTATAQQTAALNKDCATSSTERLVECLEICKGAPGDSSACKKRCMDSHEKMKDACKPGRLGIPPLILPGR